MWGGILLDMSRKLALLNGSTSALKEVELVGFTGHPYCHELVSHFVETPISLEKIIIDPQ